MTASIPPMRRACARDAKPLSRNLMTLQYRLEELDETRSLLLMARDTIQSLTHAEARVWELEKREGFYDPSSAYWKGCRILSAFATMAASQITDATSAFEVVVKSDPVMAAEFAATHAITPFGPLWTGEEFPEP